MDVMNGGCQPWFSLFHMQGKNEGHFPRSFPAIQPCYISAVCSAAAIAGRSFLWTRYWGSLAMLMKFPAQAIQGSTWVVVQQSPDNHTMLNHTTLLFAPNLPGIKWNVNKFALIIAQKSPDNHTYLFLFSTFTALIHEILASRKYCMWIWSYRNHLSQSSNLDYREND